MPLLNGASIQSYRDPLLIHCLFVEILAKCFCGFLSRIFITNVSALTVGFLRQYRSLLRYHYFFNLGRGLSSEFACRSSLRAFFRNSLISVI